MQVPATQRGPDLAFGTPLHPTSVISNGDRPHPPGDAYELALVDNEDDEIARIEAEETEAERKKESQRLVTGMDDDDLNALLRVFDKEVHHVRIRAPLKENESLRRLDLDPSPNEEFEIDKLRSHLERFYSSVIIGLGRAVEELQRIREWKEGGSRTLITLCVYTLAWSYDLIITTFLLFLSTLVLFPPARYICFRTPTISTPTSTAYLDNPANETSTGPAATETKAADWAGSIQDMFTSIATPSGGGKGGGKAGELVHEQVNGVMVKGMDARKDMEGEQEGKVDKKDVAMEIYGKPAMKVVGGLADKWERTANTLNPTPPFFIEQRRIRVFGFYLAPLILGSTFISEHLFSRLLGLIFGFLLFGQPIITRTLEELDRRIPHWKEKLILENNILADVPTNSQLILRLLRDAEHKRRPLPPPDEAAAAHGDEDEEDDGGEEEADEGDTKVKMQTKMKTMTSKMGDGIRDKARKAWDKTGSVKEEGFAFITGHKKVDYEGKARAKLDKLDISQDSKPAKAILNRLPAAPDPDSPDNPSRFYVHHGKHGPGHLIIHPPTVPEHGSSSFTPARITFTTIRHVPASRNVPLEFESEPSKGNLTISINDIISLKKEGMSLPGRILTSWALNADGAGGTGLEITIVRRGAHPTGSDEGDEGMRQGEVEKIKLTGIVRRNELFNRLLSLGEQQWETM